MPAHVFVDESKAKGLLMAATMCPAADVNAYRRTMTGLLMPRERRIHFTKESPPRRRKILGVIAEFGLAARCTRRTRTISTLAEAAWRRWSATSRDRPSGW